MILYIFSFFIQGDFGLCDKELNFQIQNLDILTGHLFQTDALACFSLAWIEIYRILLILLTVLWIFGEWHVLQVPFSKVSKDNFMYSVL